MYIVHIVSTAALW